MTPRWPVLLAGLAGLAGEALACHRAPAVPVAAVHDGIAIALYARSSGDGYGVVDDRRWVAVSGDTLVLDRVDPGAALPSLVIEPLAGGPLDVGACLRHRIAPPPAAGGSAAGGGSRADPAQASERVAPVLRCTVRARPGRYLVRLLYVSPGLGYRAQHDVALTAPGRATVVSRFAIVTPAWRTRADVALFDGAPGGAPRAAPAGGSGDARGGDHPPREIARGTVALDGGTAVLALAPRAVDARLRRIYDGAVRRPDRPDPRDPRWGRDSHPAVWVWLELGELAALPPGPVHAHVELAGEPVRDIDVPAAGRRRSGGALRLPLWIDEALHGKRDRWTEASDDAVLSDRFLVSVANRGDAPREVWIEEALRPASRRTIAHAWPRSPELGRHRLRMKLTVAPGAVERAGFAIDYER